MSIPLSYIVNYGKKSNRSYEGIIFVQEEDFQIPIGEKSFGLSIDRLNEIQKEIISGKSFPELFMYDDISLWWFIVQSIYPQVKKTINFTEKFLEFIEETKPNKMIIDDFQYFEILIQTCKKYGIEYNYSKLSLQKFKIKQKLISIINKYRFLQITNKKIQSRLKLFHKYKNTIPNIDDKIIFSIQALYRRKILNISKGQAEEGEWISQILFDLIGNPDDIVGMDLDYTFKGNTDVLEQRLKEKINWFPMEVLLLSKHYSKKHSLFLLNYKKLIHSKDFQNLFNYKGINLWTQLADVFIKMQYAPHLPLYMKLIDSLSQYFKNHKPKAIFLPYETGPYALSIIAAAKKNLIKTIGVTHAVIDKNNPMYSYEIFATPNTPYGFLIPDKTLLYGDFSRRMLLERGYPIEHFIVFGNPSYFQLNKIKSILKKNSSKKKFHNFNNSKIILFGTALLQEYYSAQNKVNYDPQVWKKLLQEFGNKNDFTIILKPHPGENIDIYKKILLDSKVNNAYIIQDELLELLYVSSIVISIFSNFILDAIVLDKPVIRVEFDNIGPTIPYDEFGVVVSSTLDNLYKNINEILSNDEIKNKLGQNRNLFLKDQFNIPEEYPDQILKNLIND